MPPTTSQELFAGSLAGMANITVCHPMDTVRTKLQTTTSSQYRNSLHCAVDIFKTEGILGFYKGFTAPFLMQAFYKSVIFATNSYARKTLPMDSTPHLKTWTGGAIAGSINSFVVTPVELIRNKLIVQKALLQTAAAMPDGTATLKTTGTVHFSGPIHVIRHLYVTSNSLVGFMNNFFKGLLLTALRDGGGMGFYFLVFELGMHSTKDLLSKEELQGNTWTARKFGRLIGCGAMSGIAYWAFALPFDCLKTKVQLLVFENHQESMWSVIRKTSIRELYRGLDVALMRGIPGAASTLTVYNLVISYLN